MKKLIKFIMVIIILMVLVISAGMVYLVSGLAEGKKVDIGEVNLASVEDGTYTGSYDSGRWTNEVKVTVKDHLITEITLVRDVTFVQPGLADEVFRQIIAEQTVRIPTLSGATVTTNAYLKAVEDALINK